MLQDIERIIQDMQQKQQDKEYLDIVYDIESFLIDLEYQNVSDDPVKQSKIGKKILSQNALEENEAAKVCSRIRPVLCELGIPVRIKGFRMIEMCTLEALRAKRQAGTFCIKDIYNTVARKFVTTPDNCERLCRYACLKIEFSQDFSKKYPYLEAMTHRTYETVTVKELVDNLSEYLVNVYKFKRKKSQTV